MNTLALDTPFGAPVYHRETVSSTMDEARLLAKAGAAHGTVVTADFQTAGRGRMSRPWEANRGANLFATLLLRYASYAALPVALTLRIGLATAIAIESYIEPFIASITPTTPTPAKPPISPPGRYDITVKWPNDVMIGPGKTAGILTEADGAVLYIGIGVNVGQKTFPEPLRTKATSIAQALEARHAPPLPDTAPRMLLERILAHIFDELPELTRPMAPLAGRVTPPSATPAPPVYPLSWHERLTARLYMRGRTVRFLPGGADAGQPPIEGLLVGIGGAGELLLQPPGAAAPIPFITGELAYTPCFSANPS